MALRHLLPQSKREELLKKSSYIHIFPSNSDEGGSDTIAKKDQKSAELPQKTTISVTASDMQQHSSLIDTSVDSFTSKITSAKNPSIGIAGKAKPNPSHFDMPKQVFYPGSKSDSRQSILLSNDEDNGEEKK